ncbi:hypothetical protein [Halocalculus aciditolerans]|uniref:Uncharacterized protein n=1 Tax=Halocalculus aciditolerans TaxID=1383812 RepID=A0A830FI58_9EURY|nr:hypothetical protein [Halocalculus aciditolerans]GGL57564.1 hypothetical protein GCM10009039_14650 [Halocalculus aciditolerans]
MVSDDARLISVSVLLGFLSVSLTLAYLFGSGLFVLVPALVLPAFFAYAANLGVLVGDVETTPASSGGEPITETN